MKLLEWYFRMDNVLFMALWLTVAFGIGAWKSYRSKISTSVYFEHQRKHDERAHAAYVVHALVAITFFAVAIQRALQLI